MIDRHLLPIQRALLAPIARLLVARNVTADQVTLAAFGLGLMAMLALAFGAYAVALALILLNRVFDGLDGAIARLNGPTDRGAFLDIACDFLFYALVPLGFALAEPTTNALPAAVLICSFVGTGSSFLAFATIAAKRGQACAVFPGKGIHYLGGLTEGAETVALFVAICLWPTWFPLLAYLFAALCFLTTGLRWHMGWRAFTNN